MGTFELVASTLRRWGVLLLSDATLPSVASLVAQEVVSGSWWGHPKGREIYEIAERLAAHPDVAVCRLLAGKVTYLHRDLWPHLAAVGEGGQAWQLEGLSPLAGRILSEVQDRESVRSDRLSDGASGKERSKAVTALESRLLIYAESVHTEQGAHARQLQAWPHWRRGHGLLDRRIAADEARSVLESRITELSEEYGARVKLPWIAIPR